MLEADNALSKIEPSFISPSPIITKILWFFFLILAAKAMPTAIGIPWPNAPVELRSWLFCTLDDLLILSCFAHLINIFGKNFYQLKLNIEQGNRVLCLKLIDLFFHNYFLSSNFITRSYNTLKISTIDIADPTCPLPAPIKILQLVFSNILILSLNLYLKPAYLIFCSFSS